MIRAKSRGRTTDIQRLEELRGSHLTHYNVERLVAY